LPGYDEPFELAPVDEVGASGNWMWTEQAIQENAMGSYEIPALNASLDPVERGDGDVISDPQRHRVTDSEELDPFESSTNQNANAVHSRREYQSLDQKPEYSCQVFGYTNESDPFLLERFPCDSFDELGFFRLIYRNMRPTKIYNSDHISPASKSRAPVHFLCSHSQTVTHAKEMVKSYFPSEDTKGNDREALIKLVTLDLGVALISL
jgi:hypothetical protein